MKHVFPLEAIVLGSGTSTGVPVVGCECKICKSRNPKDKRDRTALLITTNCGDHLVIDTPPEFRLQMLREKVLRLQHVLYTHSHADHCHGFDDLRGFYFSQGAPITCYIPKDHLSEFETRFSYVFIGSEYLGVKPEINIKTFFDEEFEVCGLKIWAMSLPHGDHTASCFKIGSFVYATDFKDFPDELIRRWAGKIETMVASGIYFGEPHPTHNTINETLELFDRLRIKKGIITHLSHRISYDVDSKRLPANVELAYDGMKIRIDA